MLLLTVAYLFYATFSLVTWLQAGSLVSFKRYSSLFKVDYWFWSDGTPFTYTNWCPGQPDNVYGEICTEMNFSGKFSVLSFKV